jgi:hypothetical protein
MTKQNNFKELFKDPESIGTPIGLYDFTTDINQAVLNYIRIGGKKVKFIADWKIVEIPVDDEERKKLDDVDLINYVVVARAVINERYVPQSHTKMARSAFLQNFHLNCIFETERSFYVLCNIIKSKA